jgi:amidase
MSTSATDPSAAFIEHFDLPPLREGVLDGLRFTVKDNIDLAGYRTSYGNPSWRDGHVTPVHNALCVDQLLAAGARCIGKVVADEFTYSLDGESFYFGTPRNAKAPDRVPGGSSSGSAASVAGGAANFSLCTDSGGSIRVPASLCGIWGMRPSLHRVSEAGVLPFQPSVSTVGVLADHFDVLDRAMRVLLNDDTANISAPKRIVVLQDALEIADTAVRDQAETALQRIADRNAITIEPVRFAQIVGEDIALSACNLGGLRDLQTAEFQSTVGNWIEACKPELGATFAMAYENVRTFNRVTALDNIANCARLFRLINAFFTGDTVVCFPTTPKIAPLKGSLNTLEAVVDFYDPTMTITAFSGVARLPEISSPLLTIEGCPVGLSFVAGHYQDEFLLNALKALIW